MSPESATARVARLLTMVPWLLRHQGVPVEEAAAEFGLTPAKFEADLSLLFLCGLPGGMPDDLIEADWDSGRVYLGNADAIARPLRLGLDEALTLMVGLRALRATPELADTDVVDRALAKLVEATGTHASELADEAGRRIHVEVGDGAEAAHLSALRGALRDHRRVHLRYHVSDRDEATERDVDPMRVLAREGHWYLEGWCHRADAVRLFRLDRIEELGVLDVDGTPPAAARPRDLADGVFSAAPDDRIVELDLDPGAHWVADYYPHERAEIRPDRTMRLVLRVARTDWVRRLVWRTGGAARVVAPPELAEQVHDGARAALAAYGPRTTGAQPAAGDPRVD
ncbi:helix-turn-helix transcriptional regulator [Agilicoccus flavus]|uniref:helix-turn-helix transcriptional regulator n=1 Tax=Agilicoccus flavus TaxID=2775968 RepID=UPI001CF691D2|nr:WYL domain-containing protein [Agilicoccus flavus]